MSLTVLKTEAERIPSRTSWQLAWARLRKDKVAMASAVMIVLLIALALAAPLISKWTGYTYDFQDRLHGQTADGEPVGPSARHLLGTDSSGSDLLVRVVYGARVSLLVGLSSTLFAAVFGVVLGMAAGYFGGLVDTLLARLMDVVLSFPYLLFAIALVAVIGPSTWLTIFVIAFFSWAAIGRIVRGQVLAIKEREYIEAARSLGASSTRIMFIDMLPNLVAPVTVLASLTIPTAIVFEATLSFLAIGGDPRQPSWGNMINDALLTYQEAPWTLFVPGLALLVTTLAFNLLGDGIRDALDPQTERLFASRRSVQKPGRKLVRTPGRK